ncbi:MAG: metalloregulator ArsR/SmtB family transcription factor [Acidobacteria bacterium]|jgi:ArsR family transcriptional regulator|nr:metalloregulator ArsR/SmtB family transcription factor [Acidobacteriota bacterium]
MPDIAASKKRCARVAAILKTLAHPQRLFLLCRLARGEATVSELREACGASQSLISQHLTRMRREGIVQARREGNFVHYRILDPKLSALIKEMEATFNE